MKMAGLLAAVLMLLTAGRAQATKIQDLVQIQGSVENVVTGYGLVVGLDGTGDAEVRPAHTRPLLAAVGTRRLDATATPAELHRRRQHRAGRRPGAVVTEAGRSPGRATGLMSRVATFDQRRGRASKGGVLLDDGALRPARRKTAEADAITPSLPATCCWKTKNLNPAAQK